MSLPLPHYPDSVYMSLPLPHYPDSVYMSLPLPHYPDSVYMSLPLPYYPDSVYMSLPLPHYPDSVYMSLPLPHNPDSSQPIVALSLLWCVLSRAAVYANCIVFWFDTTWARINHHIAHVHCSTNVVTCIS